MINGLYKTKESSFFMEQEIIEHPPTDKVSPHEHEEKPNAFFMKLVSLVLNYPYLALGFTLMISLIAAFSTYTAIKVDNSLEMFTPPQSEATQSLKEYRRLFGRDDVFMVSAKGDIFSVEFLKKLKALENEVKLINVDLSSSPNDSELSVVKSPITASESELSKNEQSFDSALLDSALLDSDFNEGFELESDEWDASEGSVIEETTSLVSVRRTYNKEGALQVEPWFDPIPSQDELDRLKIEALQDPLLAERIVNQKADFTVLMIKVMLMSEDDMFKVFQVLKGIVKKYQSEDFKLKVTGTPAVNAALNEVVLNDLSKLLVLSGFAMTLALIYLFRSFFMVVGPIVVVSISVLWTMGFMALSGMTLNLLSSILPAFLLCVGLGDSIHLQSIYQGCRQENDDYRASIIKAAGLTGPPILFTSLTTMIGLFSFKFANVTAIQEMGMAGGVGVIFALLHSLITLPLFLLWQKGQGVVKEDKKALSASNTNNDDKIDFILNSLVGLSINTAGRRLVLSAGILLFLISLLGLSKLEVWHDDLATLPDDHPIKSAVLEVDQELGGVANVQIVIKAEELDRGVKNIEVLHALEKLSKHVLDYQTPQGERIVGHALSLTNVVKETRKALSDQANAYSLPDLSSKTQIQAQQEASQLLSLFELQSPEQLRTLSTIDLKASHLTLQVKWQEATSYAGLIEHINIGIHKYFEPLQKQGLELRPTGGVYLAYTIISSLLDDLIKSFSAAFLVITFLMVLMLKELKLGLLAMIPNLFPILLMIGTLGLIGIPLDLNNLLIASIALGIAVDDTIHLLHHFKASYVLHGDRELAIADSIKHAGRAMLSTSILLCIGFSMHMFASTAAVQRFGVIIGATVMVAFVVDLLICPAILRIAYPAHSTKV